MVKDDQERWWAKHRESGAWHFYDGDSWVPGVPPGYRGAAPDSETSRVRTPPTQHSAGGEAGEWRKGMLPWAIAAGIVGVVVIVAALAYLWSGDARDAVSAADARGTPTVELPDVVGMPGDEAERILRDRGFEVVSETREASEEYAGEVIAQSPSGDEVKKGSNVTITVGEAPPDEKEPAAAESAAEEAPAPGYSLAQDPSGSLTVEVPSGWGIETGKDSEGEGGLYTWSYYAGEYLTSSITAASSVDEWYEENASGAYLVASENLAREHTDYELTHSLFFAPKALNCTPGPYEDLDRPSYSGKIQTWYDCGASNMTTYSAVAAPEGRGCVVVLSVRLASDADRKAIEHILDTFDADCDKVSDA